MFSLKPTVKFCLCALWVAWPALAMEVTVHVDDSFLLKPVENAGVQCIFNPGTVTADTVTGVTDAEGLVTLQHDLVSPALDPGVRVVLPPYPNPARSTVILPVAGDKSAAGDLQLTLYDLRGRRVFAGRPGAGSNVLPRSLPTGRYVFRLADASVVLATGSFAVLGSLDRVEVRFDGSTAAGKSGADEVLITVSADGYETLLESDLLPEGAHDLFLDLHPGPCRTCVYYMEAQIEACAAQGGCSGMQEWLNVASTGCEHLSEPAYSDCGNLIYPNSGLVASELSVGTEPFWVCVYLGRCIPAKY